MASPTNPHLPDSSIQPSLEDGLAALKAKDYPRAIAHLEAIAKAEANQRSGLRAQMGLVIAYKKTGKVKDAIALCSSLTKSSNSQAKAWAEKTLKDLVKRNLPKVAGERGSEEKQDGGNLPLELPASKEILSVETGFIPFETPTIASQPTTTSSSETIPNSDLTGFVPFDATAMPNVAGKIIKQQTISPPSPTSQVPNLNKISGQKDTEITPPISLKADVDIDSNLVNSSDSLETLPISPEEEQSRENNPHLATDSSIESSNYQLTWRNSDRAQKWRPLKRLKFGRFWFEQIATAIALFLVTVTVVKFILTTVNAVLLQFYLLTKIPLLKPIQLFYLNPAPFLQFTFGLLLFLSPWLMDALLKQFHGLQPLPMTSLFNYSKEANGVLRSFCRKRDLPVPTIKVLPTSVPIAMTYGCLPRFARIVVSQGLLEQLSADEIAAVFARELGHIVHWDFAVMSLATMVIQVPYTIYWQAGYWGDRVKNLPNIPQSIRGFLIPFLRGVAIAISSASYGIFWLLRWPVLWLSRRRVYYSDRLAADITGNPNALTRAIAKMAIGIAEDVRQQQQISYLLEGFEFLTPLGIKQAVTLGSTASLAPLETLLQWDVHNPYRKWLEVNNSHPLIGERLHLLTLYAQHWKLETELDLATKPEGGRGGNSQLPITKYQLPTLLLQGAPFFGIPMSLAIAGGIWLIGWIFSLFDIWQLDWLKGDRGILIGCLPIGFSLGTLIRINYFFPDIKPSTTSEPTIADILSNPETLPLDSQPVQLQGKLLGKSGINNWLGQDLMLETATGLVTLHHLSILGPIGNLWPVPTRPSDLIGKSVIATGWLRRGATVAIELENLRTESGRTSYSAPPIWSTILAFAAALWGAYIIFNSGR
ncbi:zinc metalloprotease HtpX [Kamptonema sp. UHCC 0994]|uniref:zinc metalloprotease HtpX n=1 Tax=Kamptonema sp. UHCC 0994 TaxID=3031329 RepID=UPI0023B9F216|nr:zinc metalloprotease HtpX [Kamptonema sp. UHCC 0994]MDF0552799.1 zinc metalloprotease HtpX [Kamptonema sp. UHCC 0994]